MDKRIKPLISIVVPVYNVEQYLRQCLNSLINQKNNGVSVARNVGVEIMSGKYYMFVDCDDWITLGMCKDMYALAEKYNADCMARRWTLSNNGLPKMQMFCTC